MPPVRSTWLPVLLALAANAVHADTFHVAPAGQDADSRDGKSAEAAWRSLAYACERVPAGDHTIQLASGTFIATRTAKPRNGVTIAGQGRDGDKATRIVAANDWKTAPATTLPKPATEFLIAVVKGKKVAIREPGAGVRSGAPPHGGRSCVPGATASC